jgi:hypothetical protein
MTPAHTQFHLPRPRYDLAVFLGILYHLKNPMYAMEHLARHTRYFVLSTRVARFFPSGRRMPQDPLKRLFERTHWKVLEYGSAGDTAQSTPVGSEHDERVFCLLESQYGFANIDILSGWHQVERESSRWTMRQFAARIILSATAAPDRLRMRVYVPPEHLMRLGPLRLEIDVDGEAVAPALLDTPGYHDIVRRFCNHGHRALIASFQLDKALPPDDHDPRKRGLVVVSLDTE